MAWSLSRSPVLLQGSENVALHFASSTDKHAQQHTYIITYTTYIQYITTYKYISSRGDRKILRKTEVNNKG